MNYELAKKLKDAGFPQKQCEFFYRLNYHTSESFEKGMSTGKVGIFRDKFDRVHYPYPRFTTADMKWNQEDLNKLDRTEVACPSLSELIEACGGDMFRLERRVLGLWTAQTGNWIGNGQTPEEAVANIWLALHQNKEREAQQTPLPKGSGTDSKE